MRKYGVIYFFLKERRRGIERVRASDTVVVSLFLSCDSCFRDVSRKLLHYRGSVVWNESIVYSKWEGKNEMGEGCYREER